VNRRRWRMTAITRGYTLVELLLVLTLLAVIAGLIWPALAKPFASRRLHTAADVVRTELCQARVDAMRSGHTYAFRYVVDNDRFCTAPRNDPCAAVLADAQADASALSEGDGYVPDEETPSQSVEKTLPEGVKFVTPDTPAAASLPSAPEMESSADLSECWSDPILFYPDGTTSDARLMLANDGGSSIEIMLRGLTGTVSMTDPVAIRE
jgi:prepilin-type N-terminal cleavage/methylation domain-containing protein